MELNGVAISSEQKEQPLDFAYTKSSFTQNQAPYLNNGSNNSRALERVAGSRGIFESFIELVIFRKEKEEWRPGILC